MLYSFTDFCGFILIEEIEIPDFSYDVILREKIKVDLWRKSYGEKDKALAWIREEKDYEMLITPEQVNQYSNSENAQMATTLFEKLMVENISVNQTEYCYLRDHLYSVIHFGNGVESMFVIKVTRL